MTERDAWLKIANALLNRQITFICVGIWKLPCCIGLESEMFCRMRFYSPSDTLSPTASFGLPWWADNDTGRHSRIEFCHKMAALCAVEHEPVLDYAI